MTSLTTPARVVVLLTAAVVVLILLLANAVGASGPEDPIPYTTHRVTSGDTLWDIAGGHTPAGGDVRNTVFEISRLNDLEGSIIVPGQVLRIPVTG